MSTTSRVALAAGTLALLAFSSGLLSADPAPAKPPLAPTKAAGGDEAKVYAAQSTVAAKTTFKTVPASDKSLAGALDAKALTAAAKLVGKPGSFQGTVSKVYSPKNHSFVALDFAPNYHEALTANIAPGDYAKLPDLTQLSGKHVIVTGKFVSPHGAVQLAVTSPDQIKIVP